MPEHNCEVFDMYQEGRYFSVRCRVCYKPALWYDLHSVGGGLAFQFLDICETFDSRDAMYLTREEAVKLRMKIFSRTVEKGMRAYQESISK